ncbi:Protein of unknown function DUF1526 [Sulfurimonas denitrificans DSM 1251]|uniref:Abi-like protein n=1 Tax=Sulfurimonas denitrificans (strain ATCC 33889 / DSM 1251) TaxID=326298 RepID=Q30Q20_SULDN|nr:Abi family protein [Sulfurimonas denitrificans]ABB44911.1 Protein of unknown function DUF1526 [Sulfurimonas denitrificans DSM 1251]
MKDSLINEFISEKRFNSYRSIEEYRANLHFSKKSYIPLSVLEIALRNSIDNHLTNKISNDWYLDETFLTQDSIQKIKQAIEVLEKRREATTKHKVIAELSLGFWVNLFKKPYDKKLRINDLKKIFPNLPNKNKKFITRDILYKELDHIRNFRNRVFHYEKVINKNNFEIIFDEIYEILKYFDTQLYSFTLKANE